MHHLLRVRRRELFRGNNEDWSDPDTFMWFEPGESDGHGCVYFGFSNGWAQGGMNEAGLFFDGAATRPLPLEDTEGRKPFRRDILELVMRSCATVDEAVALLEEYDLQFMERAMLFFGDADGNSVIYEGDEVIRKPADARHQVVTNYYQSRQDAEEAQCRRKIAAEKIFAAQFSDDEPLTLDLMRDVLDATHQEGEFATKYSNVYDLKRGFIHLYRNHDFERVVTVSLSSELALGAHKVKLADLFAAPARLVAWPWNTNCRIPARPCRAIVRTAISSTTACGCTTATPIARATVRKSPSNRSPGCTTQNDECRPELK